MEFYNKENNLVTISNSLLKHYGCQTFHDSCKQLDEILAKTNKKICVILLDGMGQIIQEHHQEYCPYVLSHKKIEITSVFPPTTTAATTSLLTGRYPIETGWLGWNQKFEMWDKCVTMFRSMYAGSNDKTPISVDEIITNKTIDEMICEQNKDLKINTYKSLDLKEYSIEGFFEETNKILKQSDFLYSYLTDPDHTLHEYGECSKEVNEVIKKIDDGIKEIVKDNPDTLFLTLADHGHKIISYYDITEYPDFFATLKHPFFTLEPRASVFYVKDDKKDEFKDLAYRYFGKEFEIYSKDEIKDLKIFGEGKAHPLFDYFIGDFILIATKDKGFYQPISVKLKSQHAGCTEIEKKIAVGIYNE